MYLKGKGKLPMKRTIVSQQKNQEIPSQARKTAESLEESGGPGILDLLKFGIRFAESATDTERPRSILRLDR